MALAELLCGTRAPAAGTVTLRPWRAARAPRALVASGVARIPEDRHAVGVVGDLPVWENAVPSACAPFRSRGLAGSGAARRWPCAAAGRPSTCAAAAGWPAARALSGGNMQKLILGPRCGAARRTRAR